jgi:hypothetical protein
MSNHTENEPGGTVARTDDPAYQPSEDPNQGALMDTEKLSNDGKDEKSEQAASTPLDTSAEDHREYPSGPTLAVIVVALCFAMLLMALE